MISAITPTIMDGTVVRWYADEAGETQLASASRNRLEFYAEHVPADVRDAAAGAHLELSRDRNADVRHYATHEHQGLFGPLTPIRRDGD
jgi:hypothetical protein